MSIYNLNEVYIGSKAVAPLQEQLSIILNKVRNSHYSSSINVDKDVLKFNRLVENFFGYSTFSLNISPDTSVNAYALPTDAFMTPEQKKRVIKELSASKNGFRHNPANGSISCICTLNKGIIDSPLTNEEIFAVMLHEIGHTFFEAVTDKNCQFTINKVLLRILSEMNSIIVNCTIRGKKITEDILGKTIKNIFSKFSSINLSNIFNHKFINIHSIRSLISPKHESMGDNMGEYIGYTNEKFADSFAVMYGYGVQLHSALIKMGDYVAANKGIHQSTNPIIVYLKVSKWINEDIELYMKDRATTDDEEDSDVHPARLARIKVSMDYIKHELQSESMDPKMKKELLDQLHALEKLIDDYENYPVDKDNIRITRMYYVTLYKKFNGDVREKYTDNDALFDTIDERFKELTKDLK